MQANTSTLELTVPIIKEELSVEKKTSTAGRVRVRSVVDERELWINETLAYEEATVERVPMGQELDAWPEPRWEGDVLVIPVVEEVVVAHKALVLKEEVRIKKIRHEEPVQEPVTLRRTEAVVERD